MNDSNQRQSAPTGAQNSTSEEQADRPLGDAACCALLSIIQGVGAKLEQGFTTKGIPCRVKPFAYGFEIQMSGVSLCIGGRGTVEEPNLCVSSCECDLVGNITGPVIDSLKLETPIAPTQPCLDSFGEKIPVVRETLPSGDCKQATNNP